MTLYTAVGHLILPKGRKSNPSVLVGGQEHVLVLEELTLWSSLAFQILTLPELKAAYEKRMRQQEKTAAESFDYFLRRLLLRKLVATGRGLTGVDALYRLLSDLYMEPVKDSFPLRLFSCIHLYTSGKIPLSEFQRHLKKPQNTKMEALVLELSREMALSVAELLCYLEFSEKTPTPPEKAKEVLYDDTDETCDTLAEQVSVSHIQMPVLQAIANLYLQKQIMFYNL